MRPSVGSHAVGVVLAAGLGTRVGADGNKAYLPIAGRSMVSWSLATVTQVPGITRTVLVFRRGESALAGGHRAATSSGRRLSSSSRAVTAGTRSEFNVLTYLAADIESGSIDAVLIHDAARPMAAPDMFITALSVAREFGGAVPAVPVPDVVTAVASGGFAPARGSSTLVRVQTPQAFRAAPLLRAYRAADRAGFEGTDTASCIEKFTDVDVRTFAGQERNLKVTYAHDIAVAERLLTNGRSAGTR